MIINCCGARGPRPVLQSCLSVLTHRDAIISSGFDHSFSKIKDTPFHLCIKWSHHLASSLVSRGIGLEIRRSGKDFKKDINLKVKILED